MQIGSGRDAYTDDDGDAYGKGIGMGVLISMRIGGVGMPMRVSSWILKGSGRGAYRDVDGQREGSGCPYGLL